MIAATLIVATLIASLMTIGAIVVALQEQRRRQRLLKMLVFVKR